jgi:hypothetical protein
VAVRYKEDIHELEGGQTGFGRVGGTRSGGNIPGGGIVTEVEWLSCTNPHAMLAFLRGKASERQLRLFACACCRDIWELITSELGRNAVEASEEYAAGRIRRKDLIERRAQAQRHESDLAHWAAMAASRPEVAAGWVAHLAADARDRPGIHRSYAPTAKPSPRQCQHLRDIFGPLPFRSVALDPAWLAWSGGTVVNLAQAINDGRRFGDLPILADALEEAGCTDADILVHLRSPGPHVRGCWALDLLTGRS